MNNGLSGICTRVAHAMQRLDVCVYTIVLLCRCEQCTIAGTSSKSYADCLILHY
jgi:hypothetical protein